MRLEFDGAPEVDAPRETVWARVMDPEFVASCAPGIESVEPIDETHFTVVSAFGVGNIKVRFRLNVELSEVVPPERATMRARGKAPGSAVDVTSRLRLDDLAPDKTRLSWSAESHIYGKVASVGARLMKGTAKKLTEGFWEEFAARAGGGSDGAKTTV